MNLLFTPSPAHIAAEYLISALQPFCNRIELSGSLRRGLASEHDIDLLAIPTIRQRVVDVDMFTKKRLPVNLLWKHLDGAIKNTHSGITRHPPLQLGGGKTRAAPWGQKMRKLQYRCPDGGGLFSVDLYTAPREHFGAAWLIRTGPADFSRDYVVALRSQGLEMRSGVVRVQGTTGEDGIRYTPTEGQAFALAGRRFITPQSRRAGAFEHIAAVMR